MSSITAERFAETALKLYSKEQTFLIEVIDGDTAAVEMAMIAFERLGCEVQVSSHSPRVLVVNCRQP